MAAGVKIKGDKCLSVSSDVLLKGGSDRSLGGGVGGVDYVMLFMLNVFKTLSLLPLSTSPKPLCAGSDVALSSED